MDKTKVNLSLDDTEQKVVSSASKKDDVATTETTSEPIATATEDIDVDDITNSDESTSEPNATTTEDIDEDDITISDKSSPIVLLFGPMSSGKSMTLVRLSRYLRDEGFIIKTDKNFKSDSKYKEKCDAFMANLDTKSALPGNAYKDFLLVKVIKGTRTICQFLEAPGEHYFDPKNIGAKDFPPYMTKIIRNLRNRKIWVFITEADWNVNNNVKKSYIRRIANCKAQLVRDTDRFIILHNKVDQKEEVFIDGHLSVSYAERLMNEEYDGLARLFENKNFFTSLWRKYNYKYVPFCTGYYEDKTLKYTESEPMYPALLWTTIEKCIRG